MAAATPIFETELPSVIALEVRVDPLVIRAGEIAISNAEEYARAADFLRDCKTMQKDIRETMDPAIKKAHEAHKAVTGIRSKLLDPIDRAESLVKRKMATYSDEQERIAAEARRKAEAEARRVAEEARLRDAAEMEARGDTAGAEEAISAPIVVPMVARQEAKPVAEGTSTRKKWRAEVTDPAALIRAVADGKAMSGLVIPNQQALDKLAESLKEALSIPGVKVVSETIVSARGR